MVDLDITKLTAETRDSEMTVTEPMTLNVVADGKGAIIMQGLLGVRFSIEVNKVGLDVDIASVFTGWTELEGSVAAKAKLHPKWPNVALFEDFDVCTRSSNPLNLGLAVRSSVGFMAPTK